MTIKKKKNNYFFNTGSSKRIIIIIKIQVLFSNTFKSTAFSDWIQQTNAKTNCVLVKKESKLIIILNIDFILSPLVFDLASERFL